MLKKIKRGLGWLWLLIAPVMVCLLVFGAMENINETGTRDINNPIPWAIIILVFTPIAAGLMIFGYYCISGVYDPIEPSEQ
jgi:hypothetical protein